MQYESSSDEQLMSAYTSGDSEAFNVLYARHKDPTFRFVSRQCYCQRAIAEELFQDLWMRVINASRFYRVEAKFTTWLYRIIHNMLVDYYRRQGHNYQLSLNDEEQAVQEPETLTGSEPQNLVADQQTIQHLLDIIEQLPVEQREAFLLQQEAGLSLNDIAEITGSKKETIKSRIRYAVKRIRQELAA